MKILFLNPLIDAQHNITKLLQQKGAALVYPMDSTEALQMLQLHGASIDIAVIHREGVGKERSEDGLRFIEKVKANPQSADLPIILTTDQWDDEKCAEHQNGPNGVNAYLRFPFTGAKLLDLIEAVLGSREEEVLQTSASPLPTLAPPPPAAASKAPAVQSFEPELEGAPVLEDISQVLNIQEGSAGSNEVSFEKPEISIESPTLEPPLELPHGAPPPPTSQSSPEPQLEISLEPSPELSPELSVDSASLPTLEPVAPTFDFSQIAIEAPLSPEPLAAGDSLVVDSPATDSNITDKQAAQEMPYLFESEAAEAPVPVPKDPNLLFAEPIGNAVIPGGAAQSPDLETFKKYLLLREQDVAVLSTQLKAAQDQIAMLEQFLKEERAKNVELSHTVNEQKSRIDDFENEKSGVIDSVHKEMEDLRFQVKAKTDKARLLEAQVRETTDEINNLKDRVRTDIRKIRVREKELENRLEITKKDSEVLINARENKIIELKRKLDLLEFNMDLLQDQFVKEKEVSSGLRDQLSRVAQIVRVAGGILENQKAAEALSNGDGPAPKEQHEKVS